MKAESKSELAKGAVDVMVAMVGLDEFWCSDCLAMALFERVDGAVAGSAWACTGCGAAYFDAIDLAAEPTPTGPAKQSA